MTTLVSGTMSIIKSSDLNQMKMKFTLVTIEVYWGYANHKLTHGKDDFFLKLNMKHLQFNSLLAQLAPPQLLSPLQLLLSSSVEPLLLFTKSNPLESLELKLPLLHEINLNLAIKPLETKILFYFKFFHRYNLHNIL